MDRTHTSVLLKPDPIEFLSFRQVLLTDVEDAATSGSDKATKYVGWPIISVIIVTRNRKSLETCLDSLREANYPRELLELVIVDDGAPLRGLRVAGLGRVEIINSPVKLSLTKARNVGISASSGDILAFIDDDVTVHKEWLMNMSLAFARHEEASAFVGGIVRRQSDVLVADGAPTGIIGLNGHLHFNFDRARSCRVEWMRGCSLSVRRSDAIELGGFNENLLASGAGDLEFSLRLKKSRRIMRYEPSVLVTHSEAMMGVSRMFPSRLAYFYIHNLAYVYVKLCDYPKKLVAIPRSTGAIFLLSIKRNLRNKGDQVGFVDIFASAFRGFVEGTALALRAKSESKSVVSPHTKIPRSSSEKKANRDHERGNLSRVRIRVIRNSGDGFILISRFSKHLVWHCKATGLRI